MDFLDEDAKPRFLFQSRASQISEQQPQPSNKPLIFVSIAISVLLFALTFFFFNTEPINSLLFWLASSILLGPFAPTSFTAGDISVGKGPIVQFPNIQDHENPQFKQAKKTTKFANGRQVGESFIKSLQRSDEFGSSSVDEVNESAKKNEIRVKTPVPVEEESEWNEEDFDLLKKQMAKHPVGMPRRWEVISEAFQGRHKMENVVKMAKSSSEKKLSDHDSFTRFLKDRKPLDKRGEYGIDESLINESIGNGDNRKGKDGLTWSSEEDIALCNALKAFSKDVSMRWEKIAAAVPGKTKNACMKRVTELKRDFRSSKASIDA